MRIVGCLLTVCVALAVAQTIAAMLLLVIGFALIIAAVHRPRETFGLLVFFALQGLVRTHPLATLSVLALFAAAVLNFPSRDA